MNDNKLYKKKIRDLYEEEAIIKQDALFRIYNGNIKNEVAKIPFWAAYFLKIKQIWLEKILAKYIKENFMILDAGCGQGYLSKKCAYKNCRIYGIDISFNYLKIAINRNNSGVFIQGDILNLPFKDKSFDILVCSEVLEHIPDPEKSLEEIKRVTRRLFISTVPILPKILDDFRLKIQKERLFVPGKGHIRNFQVKPYLETLITKGFKIKIVQGIGFLWWLFSWFAIKDNKKMEYISKIDAFFSNIKILRTLVIDLGVVAEL